MSIHDVAAEAEAVIKDLSSKKDKWGNPTMLTTSQIRRFLAAVTTVTNKFEAEMARNPQAENISDELAAEIKFLKVKLVYQAARGNSRDKKEVEEFIKKSKLLERIDAIGSDRKKYRELANYMEALVAYHKFYGGKKDK